jgi:hypothetical protein
MPLKLGYFIPILVDEEMLGLACRIGFLLIVMKGGAKVLERSLFVSTFTGVCLSKGMAFCTKLALSECPKRELHTFPAIKKGRYAHEDPF